MNSKRMFSIFTVADYKGGELMSYLNQSFDGAVGTAIENIKHPDIGNWEDLYDLPDEDIKRICSECTFEEYDYAGGDHGMFVGKIYEHLNNTLAECSLEGFKSSFAGYIIDNKPAVEPVQYVYERDYNRDSLGRFC